MPLIVKTITPRVGAPIEVGKLTVLVGPNNSGKSRTLRDIRESARAGVEGDMIILSDIELLLPSEEEIRASVFEKPHESAPGHFQISGLEEDLQTQFGFAQQVEWFANKFVDPMPAAHEKEILRVLGRGMIASLSAEARFKITEKVPPFDIRSDAPSNAVQAFYTSRKLAQPKLRDAFKRAFGMDIGLDWAAMGRWYLRVAKEFGEIPENNEDLNNLMADAAELAKQGDGFRSFAGVAMAMLTFPNRILLLDEPEAFLHPAQARVLGQWLAVQAHERAGQVFVATHNSDFLAGVIASGKDSQIIRLNRDEDRTTLVSVPSATSSGLVRSPLLSSQPVLDSLFHKGVVICEGDSDRAVYQTVAAQLPVDAVGEVLFIHTNGKDAIKTPATLFRESGTPVRTIVDFDAISSEAILQDLCLALSNFGLSSDEKKLRGEVAAAVEARPQEKSLALLLEAVDDWRSKNHVDLRVARRSLVAAAKTGSSKWSRAKALGIGCLEGPDADKAIQLLDSLKQRGIHVVPCGEVESWMKLGLDKGLAWNQEALRRLHEAPAPKPLGDFVGSVISSFAESAALPA